MFYIKHEGKGQFIWSSISCWGPARVPQLKKKWNLMETIQVRAKKGYSKKDVDLSAGKTMLLGKVK